MIARHLGWACISSRRHLLASRLATVARHAKALTIRHAVPLASTAHRHNVIGVRLTAITTHTAARLALPCVTSQHGLPPCPMGTVAVAACRSVGTLAVVTTWTTSQTRRLV